MCIILLLGEPQQLGNVMTMRDIQCLGGTLSNRVDHFYSHYLVKILANHFIQTLSFLTVAASVFSAELENVFMCVQLVSSS